MRTLSRFTPALPLLAPLLLSGCAPEEPEGAPVAESVAPDTAGWQPLFDGRTLAGWHVHNDEPAKFYVQDGMIVGESLLENGAYLKTDRDYDDFVMEAEVRVEGPINSGIQIRSRELPADTTTSFLSGRLERQDRTWGAGTLTGYQIEVDPSDRAWSGGLYEPAGRGWLQTLEENPAAQAAFRPTDWNRFRIEARGDTIRTWVNDVPVVDAIDSVRSTGPIALQTHRAHGPEEVGLKVFFRNLRIRELE